MAKGEEKKNRVRTSTIVLIIVFVLSLGLYGYLHGTTSIELFNPKPEPSTVQPIPVIPWDEYQQKMSQESSSSAESSETSSSSTESSSTSEPTDEPTTTEEPSEPTTELPPLVLP